MQPLLVAELAEDLDHRSGLLAQPGEVEVQMLPPARLEAGAVLVHGEASEQAQDDVAAARGVDDAPALLRHHVLRLQKCVSEVPGIHGTCVPGAPDPRSPRSSGIRPRRRRRDEAPADAVLQLAHGGPVSGREVPQGEGLQEALVLGEEVLESVDQSAARLGDGGGVVALDRQAQAAEGLERLRLTRHEQGVGTVDGMDLESGQPRLLFATEAEFHGREPLDEAGDQRLLPPPAPAAGRPAQPVELAP